jgi:hypothetical protein
MSKNRRLRALHNPYYHTLLGTQVQLLSHVSRLSDWVVFDDEVSRRDAEDAEMEMESLDATN